jgi:hypothetical protein
MNDHNTQFSVTRAASAVRSSMSMMKRNMALALVAGLVATASGQSTIAYFNGPSFQVPPFYGSQGVDLDRDGTPDFAFWSSGMVCTADIPISGCGWPFFIAAAGTNELLVSGSLALVQSFDTDIVRNTPPGAGWSVATSGILRADWWYSRQGRIVNGQIAHSGWDGTLGTLGVGYLGVRFYTTHGLHYGWIRVRMPTAVNGSGGALFEVAPVVVDWAYETRPNTPIRAGAIGSDSGSLQFRVEFRNRHGARHDSDHRSSLGTFILTGNSLRGELSLAGAFSSADIFGPLSLHPKTSLVASLGQPLVSSPDHTAFFGEATLSPVQVVQLRHGAFSVSVDCDDLLGQIVPVHGVRETRP